MTHLNLYLNDKMLKKVRAKARNERKSVSKWLGKRVGEGTTEGWPESIRKLFGCLAGTDFRRPDQGDFKDDIRRAKL